MTFFHWYLPHSLQELIHHMSLFTMEGGNLECLHPAQSVIDAPCGDHKSYYAEKLETWFEAYAKWRGNHTFFKPLSDVVTGLYNLRLHVFMDVRQPRKHFHDILSR